MLVAVAAFKVRTISKLGLQKSHYGCPTVTVVEEDDSNTETKKIPLPLSTVLQRAIDNDRLSDECWNSEMWEDERFGSMFASNPSTFFSWLNILFVRSGPNRFGNIDHDCAFIVIICSSTSAEKLERAKFEACKAERLDARKGWIEWCWYGEWPVR